VQSDAPSAVNLLDQTEVWRMERLESKEVRNFFY